MRPDCIEFQRQTDVSRETFEQFRIYERLLRHWQRAINLVARGTLDDLWHRHFLDSAQIVRALPDTATSLLDIGSGAGFPGLVLAMLGVEDVHLVESDQRKCQFLRTAVRETAVDVTIHNVRVETLPAQPFDAVTARACAPLTSLLGFSRPFLHSGSVSVFPKGARVQEELTAAEARWIMRYTIIPSITNRSGTLVRLEGVPDEATTTRS